MISVDAISVEFNGSSLFSDVSFAINENDKIEIISTTPIYGFQLSKIENIVQNFFASRRLDIEIADKDGYLTKPKEWFSVPLELIHQSIKLLSENKLKDHIYNAQEEKIIKK